MTHKVELIVWSEDVPPTFPVIAVLEDMFGPAEHGVMTHRTWTNMQTDESGPCVTKKFTFHVVAETAQAAKNALYDAVIDFEQHNE